MEKNRKIACAVIRRGRSADLQRQARNGRDDHAHRTVREATKIFSDLQRPGHGTVGNVYQLPDEYQRRRGDQTITAAKSSQCQNHENDCQGEMTDLARRCAKADRQSGEAGFEMAANGQQVETLVIFRGVRLPDFMEHRMRH